MAFDCKILQLLSLEIFTDASLAGCLALGPAGLR